VSRIGRLPITLPKGVEVTVQDAYVHVKGPKGEMAYTFTSSVTIQKEDGHLVVTRKSEEAQDRALHGTTRALLHNMVVGVSTGFTKVLEIDGVGYRAEMDKDGKKLVVYVGYSHPVVFEPPAGISFEVDTKTRQIKINGYDKEQVGQIAANIRKIRPPEPYKGKGIHYLGERIRRKAGKSGKAKK
jgi:large subunit ribosomal protein L6